MNQDIDIKNAHSNRRPIDSQAGCCPPPEKAGEAGSAGNQCDPRVTGMRVTEEEDSKVANYVLQVLGQFLL